MNRAEHELFYLGFCNSVLWPLFHYFVDGFRYADGSYEMYLQVNRRFADELMPLLQPEDLIWVHDYHLLALAQELRALGLQQPIGLFLHIPFPHIEVLRVLPMYGELVHAVLAYDVVGFQTAADLTAFKAATENLLGSDCLEAEGTIKVGDRRVVVGVFPIGVDVDAIQKEAQEAQSNQACKQLIAGLLDRRLMIGVDRLDYSKGLVERFRAYEQFLETFPENQNHVTFLQIAPLSRADVRAYAVIRRELEQASGRTNGRFAETDWTPIRYLNRNFPHPTLMGFMRFAPVGIVTPVRDGMNLVAKEFVAAQDAADPGVLVLSTLAGAAREMGAAVLVNPYDTRGMANAIQQAFTMPLPERRERHEALLQVLRRNDITAWHSRFIRALQQARSRQPPAAPAAPVLVHDADDDERKGGQPQQIDVVHALEGGIDDG
jgi:trehalose 6-phosphate synthase